MADLRTAHTADLGADDLAAARALLWDAFDDVEEDDWEHCLGGLHVLAHEDGALVGHAAVVARRLLHDGRALRCGYVEGVAVAAHARRRGIGAALMTEAARIVRGAFDLGALGTTDEALPLYERLGWVVWPGELHALTPAGVVRTPDEDGAVLVLEAGAVALDLAGPLTCDWRDGDVW